MRKTRTRGTASVAVVGRVYFTKEPHSMLRRTIRLLLVALAVNWVVGAFAAPATAQGPPPEAIREAQELLTALGYEPDPANGVWGKRTVRAYQAFLRDAGLPVQETLTPATLRAMRRLAKRQAGEGAGRAARQAPPDALHRAAKMGNIDSLTRALAAGADVNARDASGRTALMYAVDKGYVLLVEPLLAAKADPDLQAPDGATPLFMAVVHEYSDIIERLLKAGADPTIKGPRGKTPGDLALKNIKAEWAPLLLQAALDAGMNVNVLDRAGWTPLMYAADKGDVRLVEALLAAKAYPNLRAPDGATALFMAAAHGHSEIIVQLMKAGADPTLKGPKGKTATEVAQARYGDIQAAQKHEEPRAVLALLAGMSWAELEALPPGWMPTGTVFRDCEQCPEMVMVPPSSFGMGDLNGQGASDEKPVHQVKIAEPFAVGKYEVTFAEWDACVAAGGCTHRPDDEGWGRGTRPVINVSWRDVQEYVQWLSRETGQRYRLLSEAEWEYVARAGSTTAYPWGDAIGTNRANCNGCGSQWDNKGTAPAGSFEANAFGLFDTAGNVWEWVADCWNGSYRGAPSDGSAWERGDCGRRVVRGGSWNYVPENLRSADRNGVGTGYRYLYDGFRVARTLTP